MTPEEFLEGFKKRQQDWEQLFNETLPVKIGMMAEKHFKENFRQGGFDGTPWEGTRRQKMKGKNADSMRKPLNSGRMLLMSKIRFVAGQGRVTIVNDAVYAKIHNEGGQTQPTVSKKMRAFAWRQYFEQTGIKKGMKKEERKNLEASATEEAKFWKNLALTKKDKLTVKIRKRQFIGKSKPLEEKVSAKIKEEVNKILNNKLVWKNYS